MLRAPASALSVGNLLRWTLLAGIAAVAVRPLAAQDSRTVVEPSFPAVCTVLSATQTITGGVPSGETLTVTAPDTSRIQSALTGCTSGKAVELAASGANVAFLSGPLAIPSGVTLIVDGGVTLFASRNPADYQVTPGAGIDTCGVNGTVGNGCNALISVGESTPGAQATSTGSGLMGYGVVNGRGNEKLIVGGAVTSYSWWDLASNARTGTNTSQNNPVLVQLYRAGTSTLYKVTLLNSPHFHVRNSGNPSQPGFTVWGIKLLTPWTARNTDGIDPTGTTNVTIANSVISDGDDEIAISGSSAATGFSFTNLQLTSGHGVSIGSYTSSGVSNVLANGLYFNGQAADSNQEALHIKSAQDRGGTVQNIAYQNVCIKNVRSPIDIDPFYNSNSGSSIPKYLNLTFANIHVLTEGYVTLQGHDASNPVTMTFNNVVFDTLANTDINNALTQTAGMYNPQYLTINGAGPVSPALLANLDNATTSYFPHTTGVTYSTRPAVSAASAFSCTGVFASLATELYGSTAAANNLKAVAVTNPATVTLNATLEPVVSEVSYTDPNTGSAYNGAAVPTANVQFLEGTNVVGTGSLTANGTLASATITNPTSGTHTYTANFVGDTHYPALAFGSIVVTVTAGPASQLAFSAPPPAMLTYGGSAGTVTVALKDVSGSMTTSTALVTLNVVANGYSHSYTAAASSGTATFNLAAVLPAGSYTYTATATGTTSATATETVGKATLTVTSTAASRIFDAPDPAFPYTITGYVNGDNSSAVSGAPAITTTAPRNANAGSSYPTVVALGTLSAANYNFSLVGGMLTISGGAAQTILFDPLPPLASGRSYQLTARATSGLPVTYTVTGPAAVAGATLSVTGPGNVTVTATSAANANYAAASGVSQSFTAQ